MRCLSPSHLPAYLPHHTRGLAVKGPCNVMSADWVLVRKGECWALLTLNRSSCAKRVNKAQRKEMRKEKKQFLQCSLAHGSTWVFSTSAC